MPFLNQLGLTSSGRRFFGATSVSVNAETMPGLKLRLDGSSDLSSWVPVESVKSYSEVETLTDANPVTGRRFYRVVAEP